jgi:UDP-2,3-diacylglucosamine pyrophosphatase LpxH
MPIIQDMRAIWLSDVHLGTRDCRAELLLDFLRHSRCDVLYLVGDIIDLESMRRSVYWPAAHTEVLRLILHKSQQGTRVVYIPGNHDDEFRSLCGRSVGGIEIARKLVHTTRSGRRLLVLHGDEFDGVIKCGRLATALGLVACRGLLTMNRVVHAAHDLLGRPYWPLAQHVKMRFGGAVRYIEKFQRACLDAALEEGVDGVVCGHIHRADLFECDGLVYCNDGDWVESCTALVEDHAGDLSLMYWPEVQSAALLEWPVSEAA